MYQPKNNRKPIKDAYFFKDIATGKWLRRDEKERKRILRENRSKRR